MKKILFLLSLIPSLAFAEVRLHIPQVPRTSGGTWHQFNFPTEGTSLEVSFRALDHRVLIRSVLLVTVQGNHFDITNQFAKNAQGQTFVLANQSLSARALAPAQIRGISVLAESFGGIASLDIRISTLRNDGGGWNPPPPPGPRPPPGPGPGRNTLVCATYSNGYQPRNIRTNQALGAGYMYRLEDCEASIQHQRKGIACAVRNDGYVAVYNIATGGIIGEYIPGTIPACLELIRTARGEFICSQGPQLDMAALLNWKKNQYIDQNYRSKQSCFQALSSIGHGRPGRFGDEVKPAVE